MLYASVEPLKVHWAYTKFISALSWFVTARSNVIFGNIIKLKQTSHHRLNRMVKINCQILWWLLFFISIWSYSQKSTASSYVHPVKSVPCCLFFIESILTTELKLVQKDYGLHKQQSSNSLLIKYAGLRLIYTYQCMVSTGDSLVSGNVTLEKVLAPAWILADLF